MGVSGGYQAARRGPSMCPGGDEQTLSMILPILKRFAAKDPQGRACVERCGLGGSGHYVKMLHNGIEHGMMSAIAEAFNTMNQGLGMSYAEIADVFEAWNAEGELVSTSPFLFLFLQQRSNRTAHGNLLTKRSATPS